MKIKHVFGALTVIAGAGLVSALLLLAVLLFIKYVALAALIVFYLAAGGAF
ncbi:hypothetical protein [Alloscardovia macacae]|uniref:Uncharacterized protein n=1 Tax=Alloscardovia macacae TaxID=1160091 RepID=A0A261F1X5_9BIFI|nr:hypothetical protein [Alloscardovia macacae]OZG53114.1 hypothetical protein ALMA_1416 [Alloscardovia macacae]